jgi:hypothetical protein
MGTIFDRGGLLTLAQQHRKAGEFIPPKAPKGKFVLRARLTLSLCSTSAAIIPEQSQVLLGATRF